MPRETPTLTWRFPSGALLQFSHLEHDKTVYSWQGAQLAFAGFDELTHYIRAHQFWYLVSRLRSKCGVRPYMRAGTNPDADSWVAELIDWWIDDETGYPDRGALRRSAVVRAGGRSARVGRRPGRLGRPHRFDGPPAAAQEPDVRAGES